MAASRAKVPRAPRLNLAAQWERRLAAEGLGVDETPVDGGGATVGGRHAERIEVAALADRAEYYRKATALLHDHDFRSRKDRAVWEMHVNGMGAGGQESTDTSGPGHHRGGVAAKLGLTRWQVQRAIDRGRRAMGLPGTIDAILARRIAKKRGGVEKIACPPTVRSDNDVRQMIRLIGRMDIGELLAAGRVLAVGFLRRGAAL